MTPPFPFLSPPTNGAPPTPNGNYNQLFQAIAKQLNLGKQPPPINRLSVNESITQNFEDLLYEQDNYSDPTAAKDFVVKTFLQYQSYRISSGVEERWNRADKFYAANVTPVKWKGTNEFRSNLGIPYSFEQIQTSLPFIESNIFNTGESWFQLKPHLQTNHYQARIAESHLNYRFDLAELEMKADLAFLDMLKYGLGALEILWDESKDYNEALDFEYLDIRDLFLDSSVKDHDIDKCRTVIRPIHKTISQLLDIKEKDPRFNIPDINTLVSLYANGKDISEQEKERALRYALDSPELSEERLATLWGDRILEILVAYAPKRVIWVVERKLTIFDQPNKYNFYPLVFFPCYPGENCIYPRGFIDIIGNYQRYATGLVNASFDNKALELNPPRFQSNQSSQNSQGNYWFPGLTLKGDSKNDVAVLIPKGISTDVSGELGFLERATEKAIGNNALTQGVPQPGNINRTRAGVQSMMNAPASRNGYHIKTIINYGLKPLVRKAYKMIQLNTDPSQQITVYTPDGLVTQTDASYILGSYNVCIDAADKLVTKQEVQQALPVVLNPLMQLFASAQFAETNYIADYEEIVRFVLTALGTGKKFSLVRQKTPEDIQRQQAAQQAQQQQQNQSKMQEKLLDQQTRLQLGQMKSQTELAKLQSSSQDSQLKAQIEFAKLDTQKLLSDEEVARELIKLIIERGSYKPLAESLKPSSQERERSRNRDTSTKRKQERQSPLRGANNLMEALLTQFTNLE